jgi:hypothetical protein
MNGSEAISDERARQLAAEIVTRPEYADWQTYRIESQLAERIVAWLRELAQWFSELRFANPSLYWLTLAALLTVALLLLAHVVWSVRAALAASRRRTESPAEPQAARFAEEAAELARAGRFLEAAHRLHLGAIELLLRHGVVDLSRFETNRVLRRRLHEARLPAAERERLLVLLDRLETRWFRDRSEDRELYEGWRTLYARLEGVGAGWLQ